MEFILAALLETKKIIFFDSFTPFKTKQLENTFGQTGHRFMQDKENYISKGNKVFFFLLFRGFRCKVCY